MEGLFAMLDPAEYFDVAGMKLCLREAYREAGRFRCLRDSGSGGSLSAGSSSRDFGEYGI